MSIKSGRRTARRHGVHPAAGYSVVELLMVMTVAIILMAIAIPSIGTNDRMRVDNAARELQQELQAARLRAVTSNRRLEVRINCPAPGQYRIVQAGFGDANRCDPANYPYPAPLDAAYRVPPRPRLDGPVRFLNNRVTLAGSASNLVLQFLPNGQVAKLQSGTSTSIGTETLTLSIGTYSKTVNVNAIGKVQLQ